MANFNSYVCLPEGISKPTRTKFWRHNSQWNRGASSIFCTAFGLSPARCRSCHRPVRDGSNNPGCPKVIPPEAESWSPSSPSWQKTLRGTGGRGGPSPSPQKVTAASFSSSPAPRWPKPFFFKKSCRLLEHDLKVSKMEMERTPPPLPYWPWEKIILRLPH